MAEATKINSATNENDVFKRYVYNAPPNEPLKIKELKKLLDARNINCDPKKIADYCSVVKSVLESGGASDELYLFSNLSKLQLNLEKYLRCLMITKAMLIYNNSSNPAKPKKKNCSKLSSSYQKVQSKKTTAKQLKKRKLKKPLGYPIPGLVRTAKLNESRRTKECVPKFKYFDALLPDIDLTEIRENQLHSEVCLNCIEECKIMCNASKTKDTLSFENESDELSRCLKSGLSDLRKTEDFETFFKRPDVIKAFHFKKSSQYQNCKLCSKFGEEHMDSFEEQVLSSVKGVDETDEEEEYEIEWSNSDEENDNIETEEEEKHDMEYRNSDEENVNIGDEKIKEKIIYFLQELKTVNKRNSWRKKSFVTGDLAKHKDDFEKCQQNFRKCCEKLWKSYELHLEKLKNNRELAEEVAKELKEESDECQKLYVEYCKLKIEGETVKKKYVNYETFKNYMNTEEDSDAEDEPTTQSSLELLLKEVKYKFDHL